MRAMIAPRAYHHVRLARRPQDRRVVSASDRIARSLHLLRVGGSPGEDVRDQQAAETPALRIVAGARAGRIELRFVGGAGIEHQEIGDRRPFIPAAPQEIAPAAAARKSRPRRAYDDRQAAKKRTRVGSFFHFLREGFFGYFGKSKMMLTLRFSCCPSALVL